VVRTLGRGGAQRFGTVFFCPSRERARARDLYTAIEAVDARLEAFYDFPNASHFIEFDLELVDFAEDGAEAGDFGVGHLHGVTGAVVLHLGCCLCLLGELGGWGLVSFYGLLLLLAACYQRWEMNEKEKRDLRIASAAG
jgi:hypothetical protein